MILDGKKLSLEILDNLRLQRSQFKQLKIAAFLIGKESEKLSFLKIKQKFAESLNIDFKIYEIDASWKRKKIRKYISQIIRHKTINAGIIQLPLANTLPAQYILNSIPPKKDIDCLSSKLLGRFYTDIYIIRPPVVEVVDFLKNKYNWDFNGKEVLVVGYGNLIGKPLTHYLAKEKATVIIANSQTNLDKFLISADFIISGAGQPKIINQCKKGAILVDFGYAIVDGKISGDFYFERLKNKASFITPTPGGTGPILVAKLFENFFKLLNKQWMVI
ncbi:MAG: bifunctional protein FolD [Candidatus Parcubacteria bacterium]|nr:MAG: bifunctional protein FolD [Candidatus Parcubacteria bacterium]